MLVGARREPFLAPCLAALEAAVDLVVVDLNGHNDENVRDLEESALFRSGRLVHEFRAFTNFAEARNHSLQMLPPGEGWVFTVDSDEVHDPEGLALITRRILPVLPGSVGILDAYNLLFIQSFRYLDGLERRHNQFVRRTPELTWSRAVHEHLHGTRGKRLTAPYIFGHFGYVRPPEEMLDKWKLYARLGDPTKDPEELARRAAEACLEEWMPRCHRYRGRHPQVLDGLREALERGTSHVARFDRLMEAHRHIPWLPRRRSYLRILWRTMPLGVALGKPGRRALLELIAGLGRIL